MDFKNKLFFVFAFLIFASPAFALMDVADEKEAMTLGEQAFEYAEYANARAYFEFAASEKPKDAAARLGLAKSYYWDHRYAQALENYRKARALKTDSLTREFLDVAIKTLEENKTLFAELEAEAQKGDSIRRFDLHQEAAKILFRPPVYMALLGPHWEYLIAHGGSAEALERRLADGYYEAGFLRKASNYYEKLAKNSAEPALFERLADVYVAQGDFEKARLFYKKALRWSLGSDLGPAEAKRLKKLVVSLPHDRRRVLDWIENEEYDKALVAARESLAFNPGDASAMALAAKVYEEKGNLNEAERLYRKALEAQPQWPSAHYFWGRFLFLKLNEYEQAIEEFAIYRAYLKETEQRAFTPEDKERREKELIQSVELTAYIQHEFLNRPNAAVKELEALTREREIKDPEVYYHLAVAYYKSQKRRSAYQAFQKVLAMNPDKELKEKTEKAVAILRSTPDYGQEDSTFEEEKRWDGWRQGVSY